MKMAAKATAKLDPGLRRYLRGRGFLREVAKDGSAQWVLARPSRRAILFVEAFLASGPAEEAIEYVERTIVQADPRHQPPEPEEKDQSSVDLATVEVALLTIIQDHSESRARRLRACEAFLVSRGFRFPR
jgi:hypothetical protein